MNLNEVRKKNLEDRKCDSRKTHHSITAEAKESLIKAAKSLNADHDSPVHALPQAPDNIYASCPNTTNHHERLRVMAAPGKPHPNFTIHSQLKKTCKTKTTAEIQAMAITLLWDWRNF